MCSSKFVSDRCPLPAFLGDLLFDANFLELAADHKFEMRTSRVCLIQNPKSPIGMSLIGITSCPGKRES
jgi:hypothetical protein